MLPKLKRLTPISLTLHATIRLMSAPYLPPSSDLTRQNLQQRGQRISSSLTVLRAFYGIMGVISLIFLAVMWGFSGTFLNALDSGAGLSNTAVNLFLGFIFILTAVFYALYWLALASAQRAIAQVKQYALSGEKTTVITAVERFNKWLSVWQWWTLASAMLSVVFSFVTLSFSKAFLPEADSQVMGASLMLSVVAGLIQAVPTIVLTWLVLASIKRFFAAVALHARGGQMLVTPAATSVSGWMLFTIVSFSSVLAMFMLLILFSGAAALIPDFGQSMSRSGERGLWWFVVLMLLLSSLVYGFFIALTAWSRGFALDTAALLDNASPSLGRSTGSLPMNEPNQHWQTSVMPPNDNLH